MLSSQIPDLACLWQRGVTRRALKMKLDVCKGQVGFC
jgi:hypothetical protein